MVNSSTQRIINKPIYDKVSLEAERNETFGVSKWALFKSLFFGRIGTVVFVNMLSVVFALPAIAVMVLFSINSSLAIGLVPYSGNIGFGLSVTVDAASIGATTSFNYLAYECLFLLPCISLFGLGFAGNMYVMSKLVSGDKVHTFKDFFRGIKRCGASSVILATLIGILVIGIVLAADFFDVRGLHVAYKAVTLVLSIMLLVVAAVFTAFFTTQTAAYKLPVGTRIRNSFLFFIGTNIQGIVFAGIAIAPALLFLIPGMLAMILLIYVLLGVSFTTLVLTLYCRGCYEKFTVGKSQENKPATYAKREKPAAETADDKTDAESEQTNDEANNQNKKKPTRQYKNPKKGKRMDGAQPSAQRDGDSAEHASPRDGQNGE